MENDELDNNSTGILDSAGIHFISEGWPIQDQDEDYKILDISMNTFISFPNIEATTVNRDTLFQDSVREPSSDTNSDDNMNIVTQESFCNFEGLEKLSNSQNLTRKSLLIIDTPDCHVSYPSEGSQELLGNARNPVKKVRKVKKVQKYETAYSCPECEFLSPEKSLIRHHIQVSHDCQDEESFECPVSACSFSTDRMWTLKAHTLRKHKMSITYKCLKCNYIVSQKASLIKHMKDVHNTITSGLAFLKKAIFFKKYAYFHQQNGKDFDLKESCKRYESNFQNQGSVVSTERLDFSEIAGEYNGVSVFECKYCTQYKSDKPFAIEKHLKYVHKVLK